MNAAQWLYVRHWPAVAFTADIHTETATSVANVSHQLATLGTTGGREAALHSLTSAVAGLSPDSIIPAIQTAVTNAANGISNTAANLYGALLPTADIINTLVTVMPAYDINLFLSGIQQALNGDVLGGLQYAFVAPIAADVGFVSLSALIELEVILNAFGISL